MRFEEKPFGAKMLLTITNNLVQTDLQELLPTKRNHLGNKEGAKAKREEHEQNGDMIKKPKAPWPTEVTASDSSNNHKFLHR